MRLFGTPARHESASIGLIAALLLLLLALPARAEPALKGVALVIGNGDYQHLAPLPNPANDARAIEEMLSGLGFDTTMSTDRVTRRLRRDLEGFVEDAEGADVAVIYYSGHGIEAGGENFLVPVDADPSALDDASERLVPLSALIDELKAKVPVTIILLDACRTNPFPPGALVKLAPGEAGAPVGTAGLSVARGAIALSAAGAGERQDFGQVIGFAAEPGKAALDGEPGGNSPYAAAILRHLGAMSGEEFGTVLRMVAEEVYLKTGGRQRPWVNESLRRLLYFGQALAPVPGAEGEILTERRRLLITIATLPDPERRQVETIAAADGVPMDALYGMLAALGAEAPKEPEELGRLLRDQTERLKGILAERDALKSEDPEIRRLAGLSDQALAEGALATAIKLLDQAKARVAELDKSVDRAEADLKRRRTEFASIYAKSAEARILSFDYGGAAEDFALAFEQVKNWDERLAWTYKTGETDALALHGEFKGDRQALIRAVEAGAEAVRLARDFAAADRASSLVFYGNALQTLGNREAGSASLEHAVAVYREAIDAIGPDGSALIWAKAWNNLGNTLALIGSRLGDPQRLDEAIDAYRRAIDRYGKPDDLKLWLGVMNNLGKVLLERGQLEPGTKRLEEAKKVFEEALGTVVRADAPLAWATMQNNQGNVLRAIAMRTEATNRPLAVLLYVQALGSYAFAMQEWTRERVPTHWAVAQANMANVYKSLAYLDKTRAQGNLEAAERGQSAAMQVMTRESAPLQWALFSSNRGRTRHSLGDIAAAQEAAVAFYAAAADDYRAALSVMSREGIPLEWANTQKALVASLYAMASRTTDEARARAALVEAAAAQQAALTVPESDADRSLTLHYLGSIYIMLGERGGGLVAWREAEKAFRQAQSLRPKDTMPVEWAYSQAGIGNAQRAIGIAVGDALILAEARQRTQEAWDTIRPFDNQYDGLLAARIAEIDAALAGLDSKQRMKKVE